MEACALPSLEYRVGLAVQLVRSLTNLHSSGFRARARARAQTKTVLVLESHGSFLAIPFERWLPNNLLLVGWQLTAQ